MIKFTECAAIHPRLRGIANGIMFAMLASASVNAQQRSLTQYQVEWWERKQGLPGNAVQSFAQSTDGYMWIGTEDGLARFDGVTFHEFTGRNVLAMTANHVTGLAVTGNTGLWIGTSGGGLLHRNGGGFDAFTTRDGLSSNAVNTLHTDSAGTVWVATANGLNRIRAGKIDTPSPKTSGIFVRGLASDAKAGLWIGTEKLGLLVLRNDSVRTIAGAEALRSHSIRTLLTDGSGGVWIGTAAGLFHWHAGKLDVPGVAPRFLPKSEVRSLLRDRTGALWIGTAGSGLLRLRGTQMEALPAGDGLHTNVITSLFEDREGSVWVGTQGAGLAVLRQRPFLALTPREGLSGEIALPILQDHLGAMWIGTYGDGLNRYERGKVSIFTKRTGLSSDYVLSLHEGDNSTLWIGTRSGLDFRKNGRIRRFVSQNGPITSPVTAMVSRAGQTWVGTSTGLWKISGSDAVSYTTSSGLTNNFIYGLHVDRDGDLWIGTNGGGLNRLHAGKFEAFTSAEGLSSDVVMAFQEDQDGTLWIGTRGGLTRLRRGKFATIRARDGLTDDNIFRILDDEAGNLWMSSNRGVFRVARSELNAVADGKSAAVTSYAFTEADGLPSSEANGAIQPAGWKDRTGRLWFPTMKGVASIDPAKLGREKSSFPVRIEQILANDSVIGSGGERIELAAGTKRVEIEYTALTFIGSSAIQFQYRLDGYDNSWVNAGTRRHAFYTNLPPKLYTFRVRARHQNGSWSDSHGSAAFSIQPYLYERSWIRIAAILAFFALIFGLDRWRVNVHRKREGTLLALVEERQRAENRYRALFDGAKDIVFTADLNGNLTSMNRQGQELFGADMHANERRTIQQIIAPESVLAFAMGNTSVEDLPEMLAPQEITLRTANGKLIPAEATIQLIKEEGRAVGIQAIVRDITERQNLESQLRQSQKLEAVGRLSAGIAHDFNNLLTIIKSTVSFLRDAIPAHAPSQADITQIESAADRAADLTQQLLAFGRKQVLRPKVLNLNGIVTEVAKLLRRTIRENVEIRLELDENLCDIEADPGQMHQVLMNLAVNARDAMPEGGVLTISTQNTGVFEGDAYRYQFEVLPGEYVCLSVRDTGLGMDAPTQEQIFEPFFSTKQPNKGTGLGLATVYGIVKQSSGYIWLESTPGSGSIFWIYLPKTENVVSRPHALPAVSSPAAAGETILVVEDDESIRRILRRILESDGYTVLDAATGEAGLQLMDTRPEPVDLVLTDVMMPGMSGIEMARQLLVRHPRLRILFASGYTEEDIAEFGDGRPGISFVHKPASAELLRQKVRELLAGCT